MFKKNKTIWIVAWSMIIALMATLCPQVVRSENADVAIYREVAAGDALTTANYDNDWDTIVREDTTSYTLVGGAGGTNVDLQAGHYAVMYGIRWDDDTGSARSVQHGQLNLDGSDLAIVGLKDIFVEPIHLISHLFPVAVSLRLPWMVMI